MNQSALLAEYVEKKQLAALLEKRRELVVSNGIEFYRPHWKQHLFHQHGDYRFRYGRFGNRAGKSQMGVAEDVAWLLGERRWYKHKFDILDGNSRVVATHDGHEEHELVYRGIPKRPVKGCILIQDWDKAEDVFTSLTDGTGKGKLLQYIPKGDFAGFIKGGKGQVTGIKVKSRWGGVSTIMLDTVVSFKQNPMGHESSAWDFIHIDEPIPIEMWMAYLRGLADTCGPMWALCTQISEPWLNDFFIPSIRMQLNVKGNVFVDEATSAKKYVITGSSFDNPHVDKEGLVAVQMLARTLGQETARIDGGSSTVQGLVYPQYEPELHVYREIPHGWVSLDEPPEGYTLRYTIDHHLSKHPAVLFAATAPHGEVYFFAELFDDMLVPEACERILNILNGGFVADGTMDPYGFIENSVDGSCAVDAYEECGVYPEKSSKDLRRGVLLVQQGLKERLPDGTAKYRFNENLRETLWEFDRYHWDPKKPASPKAKDNHMMECLYRLFISGLDYQEPQSESSFYLKPMAGPGRAMTGEQNNLNSVLNSKLGRV
jgi:hypothetical protein